MSRQRRALVLALLVVFGLGLALVFVFGTGPDPTVHPAPRSRPGVADTTGVPDSSPSSELPIADEPEGRFFPPPHPDPDDVAALAAELRAARTAAEVFALADPDHGLEVDYNGRLGHLHHPVCNEAEVSEFRVTLNAWLEGTEGEEAPLYSRDATRPFSCSTDLSVCADCDADLSNCEDATLFRFFPDATGRLRLRGIAGYLAGTTAMYPPDDVTNLDAIAAIGSWGQYGGDNALCPMRYWLAQTPPTELRVERLPTPLGSVETRTLRGPALVRLITELKERLDDQGSYCRGEVCTLVPPPAGFIEPDDPPRFDYELYFRYDSGRMVIHALTQKPAVCENGILIESPSADASECGGPDFVQIERSTGRRICWAECARFPIQREMGIR